jgi:hypothetical protein
VSNPLDDERRTPHRAALRSRRGGTEGPRLLHRGGLPGALPSGRGARHLHLDRYLMEVPAVLSGIVTLPAECGRNRPDAADCRIATSCRHGIGTLDRASIQPDPGSMKARWSGPISHHPRPQGPGGGSLAETPAPAPSMGQGSPPCVGASPTYILRGGSARREFADTRLGKVGNAHN